MVVAAGTARGAGGALALRAVCVDLASRDAKSVVQIPRRLDAMTLPRGIHYIRLRRFSAVLRELIGPARRASTYVGMSDRLPLVRRSSREVLVAQNPHLYGKRLSGVSRPQQARLTLLATWARYSARRADLIIVATEAAKADVTGATGIAGDSVVVRPIPVLNIGDTKREHRGQLERIALVGDIYGYKRFAWAIDEIAQWALESGRPVCVDHAGGIGEQTASRSFQEAVKRHQHVKVVMLGRLPHSETIALLRSADVFVFPSSRESFGLPLAEALALGVPVVCSNIEPFLEVGGPAPSYFDGSRGSLAGSLDMVSPSHVRQDMAARGLKRQQPSNGWNVVDGAEYGK